MTLFLQLIILGVMTGTIYTLVALGFVLIYRSSGILNFAQGELLLLGAYLGWSLLAQFHLPLFVTFLLLFVYAMVLGFLIERLVLRPMIGQHLIAIIMMTIGLSQILRAAVEIIWGGAELRSVPESVFSQNVLRFGDIFIPMVQVWGFVIAAILVIGLVLAFKYTRAGLLMRAAADDQRAAQASGVKVSSVFAQAWVLSAFVAAVGGVIIGSAFTISLELSDMGLKVFPVLIGGGLESIAGAVICGPLVGILENLGGAYLDSYVGGGVAQIVPYVFLIIVLIIRPHGLFGLKTIERV